MLITVLMTGLMMDVAYAGNREIARRLHDRLAGVPPTEIVLQQMQDAIAGVAGQNIIDAAFMAMDNPAFYGVTLKNIAAPWTNRDGNIFVPLNDYIATYIGLIRDQSDFRRVLYDDVIYVSNNLPAYSNSNNDHYQALENSDVDFGQTINLTQSIQSQENGLDPQATAGIMTSRAAARAFFVDGTNRAMFRYTVMNHLCYDLEQLKDTTRPADRVRQDVSRSPGGDSRLFLNGCVGCHSGMDPMAQAFAYYQWNYTGDPDVGSMSYNQGTVEQKYSINAATFPHGFVTLDDSWDNFWRDGANKKLLGWDTRGLGLTGTGSGAKSMGEELANSEAFARCHVQHAFKATCLREPQDSSDINEVARITTVFKDNNYNLKRVFAETSAYCAAF
jgi:hypothetical protein